MTDDLHEDLFTLVTTVIKVRMVINISYGGFFPVALRANEGHGLLILEVS
jgi:hypothetical protein